ncbi:uncharacterized protein [Oryza sativa Japonica Group]|uniref:Os08g0134900 protein n=3 Tax=Oryza TaxID=4527 RepID=B9FYY1_ORYSJ|nr:uncharacterized protein LOC4344604 [Oryza sativa Japonica Group]XP_015648271.1 uncharacterized protein LOC4344604 [Oryza sativa Japonica Group]KAB8107310.1 hypothetical protein EE612_041991 [Oryza sativa]EEE67998.1 hypothetical protein OsJ_25953 [Oryza sativa Japonica Group]KAF2917976.1 hypothetical protein DAI22_08g022500 [Oryza sativa Japonica Group]KAF2917977.1 hypothetical protein DAI22_08g022500 [Oryza sativa Japonica Group]BAD16287.1 unknown protein [Oryza sativa Japonica Group]|eukprot:NP_001060937.1 Os08g0134900 [Oryza sativa Japonica Group]
MADGANEDGGGSAAGERPMVAIKRKREKVPGLAEDGDSSPSSANRSVDMEVEEKLDYSCAGAEEDVSSGCSIEMEDVGEQRQVEPTWEDKVLRVLHIVRRNQFAEYDPKEGGIVYTRFCIHNIALFDLDKESTIGPGPPINSLDPSEYWWLDDSLNIIAIKVAESDVGYPVRIYGTVLARDQQDYRCVYLFRRSRDNPQLITSPEDSLTLTGPYRALASKDIIIFEFNLKILGDGDVDRDFGKGVIEHSCIRHTKKLMTLDLTSWLSKIDLVYTPVDYAVEASLAVNILDGPSDFTGKVIAWTSGNKDNEIVLHDTQVTGSPTKLGDDGSIELSRHIVVVPLDEELVLNVILFHGDDHEDECFEFVLTNYDEESSFKEGRFELQVKVIWTGVVRTGEHKMWESTGRNRMLV